MLTYLFIYLFYFNLDFICFICLSYNPDSCANFFLLGIAGLKFSMHLVSVH